MLAKIKYAEKINKKAVIDFFADNINEDNDWITSCEFRCPFWISAAINRNQIIIIVYWDEIVGWLRFYPRKKEDIVSIYQFAIDERFRSKWLMKEMLKFSWYNSFESVCNIESNFNNYYIKQGWTKIKTDDNYNYWNYKIIK